MQTGTQREYRPKLQSTSTVDTSHIPFRVHTLVRSYHLHLLLVHMPNNITIELEHPVDAYDVFAGYGMEAERPVDARGTS